MRIKHIVSALFFLVLFALVPTDASALVNTVTPNVLYDDFDTGEIKKPDLTLPWDYWYKTLISADAIGFYKQENLQNNIQCNNDVCLTIEDENGTHYARLALYPEQYPGNVNLAQLSEQRDAFSYGLPHRWLPTVGHPVTMTSRLRMSPNYHADGSGGAVGTLLIELWNFPDDYTDPTADISRDNSGFYTHTDDTFVMGFTWTDEQTLGGLFKGFKAVVVDKVAAPSYFVDLSSVNINEWFTTKIVWSTTLVGVQTISFYVNDQLVGITSPVIPMPALGVNIISDNAQVQVGPTGLVYVRANPTASQFFDIDSVGVSQN